MKVKRVNRLMEFSKKVGKKRIGKALLSGIFGLVLMCALLVTGTGKVAYAYVAPTGITRVDVNIPGYGVGMTTEEVFNSVADAIPSDAGYRLMNMEIGDYSHDYSKTWKWSLLSGFSGVGDVNKTDTFESGERYTVSFHFAADSGYEFPDTGVRWLNSPNTSTTFYFYDGVSTINGITDAEAHVSIHPNTGLSTLHTTVDLDTPLEDLGTLTIDLTQGDYALQNITESIALEATLYFGTTVGTVTVQSDGIDLNGDGSSDVTIGGNDGSTPIVSKLSTNSVDGDILFTTDDATLLAQYSDECRYLGLNSYYSGLLFKMGSAAPVTYTVTFQSNDGSDVAAQDVASGSKVSKPTNPTKDGNTFAGWYADEALTTVFDFDTAIDSDITIYAKWDATSNNDNNDDNDDNDDDDDDEPAQVTPENTNAGGVTETVVKAPKTGETDSFGLWLAVSFLGMAGATVIQARRKERA